ncbi:MAG: CTP synthase [Kiritimatiellia bacterium]
MSRSSRRRKIKMTKHIFVTGGVVSSLGKGLTAASLALLLKRRGYRVRMQKLDPYLNVDPGTMSPYQHGEVYVTVDGAETDLDLGHYERFTGIPCTRASNYTSGRIYSTVLARERAGGYLGKTVQVIPHITDEIKDAIRSVGGKDVDIAITEIGGTVGDIESQPYLEAIRQYRHEIGRQNALFIHLTLVPFIRAAGEMKTKPSQQSVGILRSLGIFPEILICRCEHPLKAEHREKLALFCDVDKNKVIEEKDVETSIYEVPTVLARQDVDVFVLELLGLHVNRIDMTDWEAMLDILRKPSGTVEIAVVGKYISLRDSYKSIYEAITHGGIASRVSVKIRSVESEDIEKSGAAAMLKGVHGVLVPGGFGDRGIEGKIAAVQYARENRIPFFGICLGMQCATIEFARNVCGFADANSTEFNAQTAHPVIDLMTEQRLVTDKGGTMRLGACPCHLQPGTRAQAAYAQENVQERHRHRYEFNNRFREELTARGLVVSGVCEERGLVEIVELPDHPWFVGCQFHPEFQSTPVEPHPLFASFLAAACQQRKV